MRKSREEISHEVESYVSEELQGIDYGDCYPDGLRELMNQIIREMVAGTPKHSIESTLAEIDSYIEILKNESEEI